MNIYDNYNIDTIRNVHDHISAILIGIFYLRWTVRGIDRSPHVRTTMMTRRPRHSRRRLRRSSRYWKSQMKSKPEYGIILSSAEEPFQSPVKCSSFSSVHTVNIHFFAYMFGYNNKCGQIKPSITFKLSFLACKYNIY